jgi:hypothetical protein
MAVNSRTASASRSASSKTKLQATQGNKTMMIQRNINELVIDDSNYREFIGDVVVDGQIKSRGLVPRDYAKQPYGSIAGVKPFDPHDIKIIPRNEWSSRIKDKQQAESQLSDFRLRGDSGQMVRSLDQNGQGYCWAYSTTGCAMLARMVANEPHVRFSAHAVACVIKNFRDEGGWGALSLDFLIKRGVPSVEFWPEKSMSHQYNNDATWENAAQYKCSEGWTDLTRAAYDRELTQDQVMSCLLQNIPVVGDFNWWGHSVALMDAIEYDTSLSLSDENRWGVRLLNSWSDRWSDRGMGLLRGRKAIPNGAVALRVMGASA